VEGSCPELAPGSLAREKPLLTNISCCPRQGGLRHKAHPEPLPSLADRKASRACHENPAERPGLTLHDQCRDYAPLQSRPSLPHAIRSRLPFGATQDPKPAEGEAAPAVFLLTEATARRGGRPYPLVRA